MEPVIAQAFIKPTIMCQMILPDPVCQDMKTNKN